MGSDVTPLRLLRQRLKAAKARALYWSGAPSFTGKRFKPGRDAGSMNADSQYELAMDDVDGLSQDIAKLTGKPVKAYDPKAATQRMMAGIYQALQTKDTP